MLFHFPGENKFFAARGTLTVCMIMIGYVNVLNVQCKPLFKRSVTSVCVLLMSDYLVCCLTAIGDHEAAGLFHSSFNGMDK